MMKAIEGTPGYVRTLSGIFRCPLKTGFTVKTVRYHCEDRFTVKTGFTVYISIETSIYI